MAFFWSQVNKVDDANESFGQSIACSLKRINDDQEAHCGTRSPESFLSSPTDKLCVPHHNLRLLPT